MTFRQPPLDGVLASHEPIHCCIHIVGGSVPNPEVYPKGGVCPPTCRGQFRAWPTYPGNDQAHHQIPFRARRTLSLIHISEPTRRTPISYAVFCLKKKK